MKSLAIILALVLATSGAAETVQVRSGEHDGFSRLVIRPDTQSEWVLGRTDTGYELRFARPGITFDAGRVFELIPRRRVIEVVGVAGVSGLRIDVVADTHATAFSAAGGAVVIDVKDGLSPVADSPFELPIERRLEILARTVAARSGTDEAGDAVPRGAGDPGAEAEVAPVGPSVPEPAGQRTKDVLDGVLPATPGGLAFLPQSENRATFRPLVRADPQLAVFWNGVALPDAGKGGSHSVQDPATGVTDPLDEDIEDTAREVTEARPDAFPSVLPTGAASAELQAAAGEHTAQDGVADQGLSPLSTATFTPKLPDPRLAAAEAELIADLGRAASQGLIEPAPRKKRPEVHAPLIDSERAAVAEGADLAPHGAEVASDPVHDASPDLNDGSVAVGAPMDVKTALDQAFFAERNGDLAVTSEGDPCLSAEALAINDWADERPFALQLSVVREKLVSEFDRPDDKAVARLARFYLHFGFGAEAMATLKAFGAAPRDAPLLAEIASILEKDRGQNGIFAGQQDCGTPAALWAVLAEPVLGPGQTVDHGAVIRAFSGLPLHLRRHLGTSLSNRFIGADAPDVARQIRDIMARAPGHPGQSTGMIDAQLSLVEGDARRAESLLEDVVAANGPMTSDAAVMAVTSRLERGAPIEPTLVETLAALAFEHRRMPEGAVLTRAYVLALGSNNDFDRAFDELARWPEVGPSNLRRDTTADLFAMLALPDSEAEFLKTYFAHRDLIEPGEVTAELRAALARRLVDSGFGAEAVRLGGPELAATPDGRLLSARALLADGDAAGALNVLGASTEPAAHLLRGEAFSAMGDHAEATRAYIAAESLDEAAGAAWRAGNWPVVTEYGSAARKLAVDLFGLETGVAANPADDLLTADGAETATATAEPAPGTLAEGSMLLDQSRATRAAIEALLAEIPATGG